LTGAFCRWTRSLESGAPGVPLKPTPQRPGAGLEAGAGRAAGGGGRGSALGGGTGRDGGNRAGHGHPPYWSDRASFVNKMPLDVWLLFERLLCYLEACDKAVLWNRIFIPTAVSSVSGYLHILLVLPLGKTPRSPTGRVQVVLQTVALLWFTFTVFIRSFFFLWPIFYCLSILETQLPLLLCLCVLFSRHDLVRSVLKKLIHIYTSILLQP